MSLKRTNLKDIRASVAKSMPVADQLRHLCARDHSKNKPWFKVTALSALDTEVMIYDEISEYGVTALDFVQELRAIATPNLTVRINSPGGQIFDGFAIYNALLNHPSRVTAYIDGVAASAASFIAQAADEIIVADASTMMVHGGSGLCYGKKQDMKNMHDLLDKLDGQMASIYAQRTERPAAEWMTQLDEDTWYTAQEAVAAGLADRVAAPPERVAAPAEVVDARTTETPVAALAPVDDDDLFLRVFTEEVTA